MGGGKGERERVCARIAFRLRRHPCIVLFTACLVDATDQESGSLEVVLTLLIVLDLRRLFVLGRVALGGVPGGHLEAWKSLW